MSKAPVTIHCLSTCHSSGKTKDYFRDMGIVADAREWLPRAERGR